VLELGPKNAVKIPVNPAKLRKYAAMNIIRWVIRIPKNSIIKPTTKRINPNINRLSVSAFQMLLI
jgi:hypothetical protein